MKQIIAAVDANYIKELRNPMTDQITLSIPEVLQFLVTRYGVVDSRRLQQEEDRVRNFSWNISDPPVVLFNIIEDLEIIAEAAQNAKSNIQLVNYGIDIVRESNEIETALLTWFSKPMPDQTWANF